MISPIIMHVFTRQIPYEPSGTAGVNKLSLSLSRASGPRQLRLEQGRGRSGGLLHSLGWAAVADSSPSPLHLERGRGRSLGWVVCCELGVSQQHSLGCAAVADSLSLASDRDSCAIVGWRARERERETLGCAAVTDSPCSELVVSWSKGEGEGL